MSLPPRDAKAFTMLELIVVIVILGILAAIAIPTFARVIEKSKSSSLAQSGLSLDRNARALAAFENRDAALVDYDLAADELPGVGDGGASVSVKAVRGVPTISEPDGPVLGYKLERAGIILFLTPGSAGAPGTVSSEGIPGANSATGELNA